MVKKNSALCMHKLASVAETIQSNVPDCAGVQLTVPSLEQARQMLNVRRRRCGVNRIRSFGRASANRPVTENTLAALNVCS
jgi:hypothetical protein